MKKYGFIMGGGAARGLAHIGVMKSFYKRNIIPSALTGTSMGAIISSLLAIGMTPQEIECEVEKFKIHKMIDFSLAKAGILSGEKIYEFLLKYLGVTKFENLTIPLRVCAMDINKGEVKFFKKGKVIDAVRASISVPGIFLPYEYNGNIYVDGGLTHNLPVQGLDEFVCDEKIALSVRRARDTKIQYTDYLSDESSFKNLTYNRVALTFDVLKKTADIIMHEQEERVLKNYPDVKLIVPKMKTIDYSDFKNPQQIIDHGYLAGEEYFT